MHVIKIMVSKKERGWKIQQALYSICSPFLWGFADFHYPWIAHMLQEERKEELRHSCVPPHLQMTPDHSFYQLGFSKPHPGIFISTQAGLGFTHSEWQMSWLINQLQRERREAFSSAELCAAKRHTATPKICLSLVSQLGETSWTAFQISDSQLGVPQRVVMHDQELMDKLSQVLKEINWIKNEILAHSR